jgi:hypothetical protein
LIARTRQQAEFLFFDGEACVSGFAAGVDESDHFGRILPERFVGDLFAVLHQGVHVLEEGDFLADSLDLSGINVAAVASHVGGAFGLVSGAVIDGLSFEVVLVTAQTPVADVVVVEVLAGIAEFFNDDFIRDAVLDQAVYLVAQVGRQPSDFAVAAGFGLAGLELAGEVVLERVGVVEYWGHGVMWVLVSGQLSVISYQLSVISDQGPVVRDA